MENLIEYYCSLNVKKFSKMLDNTTQCYKFFWLDSIMQLVARGEETPTFLEIFAGMIADAWYAVSEYHLRLGPKNKDGSSSDILERAVNKLGQTVDIKNDEARDIIIEKIKSNRHCVKKEMMDLAKNVPYRILSPFIEEIKGNDPLWDKRKHLITYFDMVDKKECLPYKIEEGTGLNKKIIINNSWRSFFIDNMVTIRGWIKMKKLKYLQDRNPGVPGIIYKLEPEKDKKRRLEKARKLWDCVMEINGGEFSDIYSNAPLNGEYDIDHFIPWSYVANDELWNLVPVKGNLNSAKNNRLPQWENYYGGFAHRQYLLNRTVHSNEYAGRLFNDCKRYNLNSIWPLDELYIEGIEPDNFSQVLYKRLHPIYESALTQGYSVWENKIS